jgi:hypothetical protein
VAILDVADEGASGIAAVVIALAETFSPASRCGFSPALTDHALAQEVDTARVKLAPNANADKSGNPKSGLWFTHALSPRHASKSSICAESRNLSGSSKTSSQPNRAMKQDVSQDRTYLQNRTYIITARRMISGDVLK